MNYNDLKRMEQYADTVRQNAFKDCAARISRVINQTRMFGERMPNAE